MKLRQMPLMTMLAFTSLGLGNATAQDGKAAKPQKPMSYKQASGGASNFLTFIPVLDRWSTTLSHDKDGSPRLHITDSCGIDTRFADDDMQLASLPPTEEDDEHYYQGHKWSTTDLKAVNPVKRDFFYTLEDGKMIIDIVHHGYKSGRTDSARIIMRSTDGKPKTDLKPYDLEVEQIEANGWGYAGLVFADDEYAYGNRPTVEVEKIFGTLAHESVNTLAGVANNEANNRSNNPLPKEACWLLYGTDDETPYPVLVVDKNADFLPSVMPYTLDITADEISLSWEMLDKKGAVTSTNHTLRRDGSLTATSRQGDKPATIKQSKIISQDPLPDNFSTTDEDVLIRYLLTAEQLSNDKKAPDTRSLVTAITVTRNNGGFTVQP